MPELLDPIPAAEADPLAGAAERGLPPTGGARTAPRELDEHAAREALRRQISRMETELAGLFGSAFPRRGIEWRVGPAGGPRVLGVGDLERLRDSLAARLQEVRGELHSRAYVEERKRELLERVITDPDEYRWVRISNEDIGERGCRHWHSRPRWGLLGMLMGWWRVRVSSGCP